MNELLKGEELAELLAESEPTAPEEPHTVSSQHGKVTPIGCSTKVNLRNGWYLNAKPYTAAYTNLGIYLKGTLNESDDESYYIAPYDSIDLLEFDLKNVEEQIAAAAAEFADRVAAKQEKTDDSEQAEAA